MKIVNDENGISYNIFEDTGTTICTLTDSNGKTYQGAAYCHEADRDMQSEKVGMAIANARAKIALYKTCRDDSRIALAALNQLYYSMKHSKRFNPKSYENIMLQKQIRLHKQNYEDFRKAIDLERKEISLYVNIKDEMYKKVREIRTKRDKEDTANS